MNSAYVYKRHSFISNNEESVRIPEVNIKHDAIKRAETPKEETFESAYSDESNNNGINQQSAGKAIGDSINFGEDLKAVEPEDTEWDAEPKEIKSKASHKSPTGNALYSGTADKEVLSVIYKKELEELSRTAAESAYFDALTKKKRELKESISSVQNILDELVRRHEEYIEQYTNELKYMAIDIAEKMLLDKISVDDAILKKLVLQNMQSVKNAEWLNIELSERLVGLVDSVKMELEAADYKGRVNVLAVAEKEDTCRITTEEGTLVSTISAQADNLRKAFREAEKE